MNRTPSDSLNIKQQKELLRRQIHQAEKLLDASYISQAGDAICTRLLSLPRYQTASAVFCFAGMPGEIPTELFLSQALTDGKCVCVPLCRGKGIMELRQIFSLSDLTPGFYGIPEPGPTSPLLHPKDISFAVIPCLTCNMEGERLGRGGGYYDRFLAGYEGFAVMVCADRLVKDRIPSEQHDIRVPNVMTEVRSTF